MTDGEGGWGRPEWKEEYTCMNRKIYIFLFLLLFFNFYFSSG